MIAVIVIVVVWAAGLAPDRSLIVLLAVTYALYLMPRRWRRIAVPAVALTLAALYPYFIQQANYQTFLFKLPVFNAFPSMDTMFDMMVFGMMAIGLNMVVGYAGLLDLGYVAFYAIGAYTAAWLASPHFAVYGVHLNVGSVAEKGILGVGGIHLSLWIVVIVAGLLAALVGILIGLPTLRLRGDYLAIVTLGFGEILPQVARNGDKAGSASTSRTAPPGINPIDPPGFGGWLSQHAGLPNNYLTSTYSFDRAGQYVNFVTLMYWTAIVLLLITIFCSIRLRDSRLGRAWIAIREDEIAAAAMGIPLMRTKTWAYASALSSAASPARGSRRSRPASFPDDFFFNISVLILCMVILGGMGNVWGVLRARPSSSTSTLRGWETSRLGQRARARVRPEQTDPSAVISGGCLNAPLVTFGIYGVIIVLVMLLRPRGLFPERSARARVRDRSARHADSRRDALRRRDS